MANDKKKYVESESRMKQTISAEIKQITTVNENWFN